MSEESVFGTGNTDELMDRSSRRERTPNRKQQWKTLLERLNVICADLDAEEVIQTVRNLATWLNDVESIDLVKNRYDKEIRILRRFCEMALDGVVMRTPLRERTLQLKEAMQREFTVVSAAIEAAAEALYNHLLS